MSLVEFDQKITEASQVQCRHDGLPSPAVIAQGLRDFSDQFDVEAGDPNPFVGIDRRKHEGTKGFDGDAHAQASARTDGRQLVADYRMYQLDRIEDRSAPRQETDECHEKEEPASDSEGAAAIVGVAMAMNESSAVG
ncbi:MAG: hypothetical protein NNA18_09010 [Nitrospira sp.]|nr:hypothetical protein [Nitrospira sp.]